MSGLPETDPMMCWQSGICEAKIWEQATMMLNGVGAHPAGESLLLCAVHMCNLDSVPQVYCMAEGMLG